MQFPREIEHFIITGALCIFFILVLDINYYEILPFILFAMLCNRIPALDARLHLGHRNPLMHSFLIPLLVSLVVPKNIYVTAFFAGFTAHMLADIDNPTQEWVWVEQKVGIAILWVSFFIILGLVFNVNPIRAIKIFD